MKKPTIKGCAGALVAVAVAATMTIVPRSSESSRRCLASRRSSRRRAAARRRAPRRIAHAGPDEKLLGEKMPDLPAEDRSRLAAVIYEESKAASLDPFFVLAMIAVESGYDNEAESPRGANGLMQLTPRR